MTSSGTYNFSLSVGEGVIAAFERVQVFSPEIRQEHMLTARREVNLLLSEWSNKQVNLWEVVLNSVSLVQGTATYSIPQNVVMVLDGYVSTSNGTPQQTDRFIYPMSRSVYATIAQKFAQGPPTTFWFDRLINPTVTMWPVPDASGPYVFNYYAVTQMQDANLAGGETPDLPYRWLDAFVAGLAHRLARIYKPELEPAREKDAIKAWDTAGDQDTERAPFTINPTLSSYYYRR